MRKLFYIILLGVIIFIFLVIINLYIVLSTKNYIYYNVDDIPKSQTALVLGAGIFPNGRISDMFLDRLDTAVDLYKNNKIEKILVSGDHGQKDYNEVDKAKDYLLEKGIKSEDLFLDHAGFSTYDSIYRARDIFGVSSTIIITQNFHLSRAVYVAKKLKVDVIGLSADKHQYKNIRLNYWREFPARIKTYLEIIFKANPKFLGDRI